MLSRIKYLFLIIGFSCFVFSQKIDTDSLLLVTNKSFSKELDYKKTITLARLGIKNAPDYLDFYLVLGRAYQKTNQSDSARFYYNYVIKNNTAYKEAFLLIAKLETEQKNYNQALVEIENGIVMHPKEIDFYKEKLQILYLLKDSKSTHTFLKEVTTQFPDETHFIKAQQTLEDTLKLDRIGITYSYTGFNRANYGPWHYTNLEYSRKREKITLIGRINYTDRRLNGTSANAGFLYEVESYFKNTSKSYSYINFGFSNNENVFPKIRASYSFFQDLGKGWEGELGFRYSKRTEQEISSTVLGLGKYFGSNWINLRAYGQIQEQKIYSSLSLVYRYYFNTKYDYVSIITGFGTSPDERETLTQFQNRITLKSKRIGIGYNKKLYNRYYLGIQGTYNHQEYFPYKFQNEINISLSLYYKL